MTSESDTADEIDEEVSKLERSLGLESGFIDALEAENDWSFVIKCHAILESVLTSLLWQHLQSTALAEPLSYLDIGHPKYGKVKLSESLNLTRSEERRFINFLTELRNRCAHGVESLAFSFSAYIDSLDKNQRQNFVNSAGYWYLVEKPDGAVVVSNPDVVLSEPKRTILRGLKALLAISHVQAETADVNARRAALRDKILEGRGSLNRLSGGWR